MCDKQETIVNAQKGNSKNVDAAIVSVLTETEHPVVLATFGLDPYSDPSRIMNGIKIWDAKLERTKGEPLYVALICLGDKGILDSYAGAKTILEIMGPKSIYLVGSAIGREGRTSICDVVVSSEGVMYYESGGMPDSGTGSKPKYVYPKQSTKNEAKSFFTSRMIQRYGWEDEYKSVLQSYHQDITSLPSLAPQIHFQMITSGERTLDQNTLNSICKLNDSVYAGEMEGYGFARACDERRIDWLVIRGISDFGSREDRKKWQGTATVMASSFLKIFLKNAFEQSKQIEILPEDSIYVREKIPDIVRRVLKEKSIDITPVKFSLDLTINKLERICHILYPAIPLEELRNIVREARATAFEEKYADRTDEDDERFINIEQWKAEFKSLLHQCGILDLNTQRVIDVGIGNGLETKGLFDDIEMFTGVDISGKALAQAERRCPKMHSVVNDAEDLRDVVSSSQDVYISLRTYQSTLFDIDAALFEAYRVLRPGGIIIISIPATFIGENKRIVKGLLLPESNAVDPDLPYRLVYEIQKMLNLLNFDRIGIHTGMFEVYIYGQRTR